MTRDSQTKKNIHQFISAAGIQRARSQGQSSSSTVLASSSTVVPDTTHCVNTVDVELPIDEHVATTSTRTGKLHLFYLSFHLQTDI